MQINGDFYLNNKPVVSCAHLNLSMIDLNDHARLLQFYRPSALHVRMRVYRMDTDTTTLLPLKRQVQRFNLKFTREGKIKEISDTVPVTRQWIFAYDNNHRMIRKTVYSTEQVVEREEHYEYNVADQLYLTRTIDYTKNEPHEKHLILMEIDNHLRELTVDAAAEIPCLFYTHKIEYDDNGLENKHLVYDINDVFLTGHSYFYNPDETISDCFELDAEGVPTSHSSFTYNEYGDPISKTLRNRQTVKNEYLYIYDKMGYWNEMHHVKNGELKWIFERQIFFYSEGW